MKTRPISDNPKGKNITVSVTEGLRKKVDKLRKTHFSTMQTNQLAAYLLEVGLREEELRFKEEEIRNKARLERAKEKEEEAS